MDDPLVANAAALTLPLLSVLRTLSEGLAEDHPQALAAAFIALMQACDLNSQRVYLGLMSESGMFDLLQNPEFSEGMRARVSFKGARLLAEAARSAGESPAAFLRSLAGMQEADMIDLADAETMSAFCGVLSKWAGYGDAAAQSAVAREAFARLVATLDTFKQLGRLLGAFLDCPANPYPAAIQNDIVRSVLRNPDVGDLGGESRDLLAALPPELAGEAKGWLAEAAEDDSSADEDGNLRDFVCDDEEVDYEDGYSSGDALETTGTLMTTQESIPLARKKGKGASGLKAVSAAAGRGAAPKKAVAVAARGRLRRHAASSSGSDDSSSSDATSSSSSSSSSPSSTSGSSSGSDDSDSSNDDSDSSRGAGRKRPRAVARGGSSGGKAGAGKTATRGKTQRLLAKPRAISSDDDNDDEDALGLLSSSSGADTEDWPSSEEGGHAKPPRKRARLSVAAAPPAKPATASTLEASIIELIGDSQASQGVGGGKGGSGGRAGVGGSSTRRGVIVLDTPSPQLPAPAAAQRAGGVGALPQPFPRKGPAADSDSDGGIVVGGRGSAHTAPAKR